MEQCGVVLYQYRFGQQNRHGKYCGNKEFDRTIWAYTNVGEVKICDGGGMGGGQRNSLRHWSRERKTWVHCSVDLWMPTVSHYQDLTEIMASPLLLPSRSWARSCHWQTNLQLQEEDFEEGGSRLKKGLVAMIPSESGTVAYLIHSIYSFCDSPFLTSQTFLYV